MQDDIEPTQLTSSRRFIYLVFCEIKEKKKKKITILLFNQMIKFKIKKSVEND